MANISDAPPVKRKYKKWGSATVTVAGVKESDGGVVKPPRKRSKAPGVRVVHGRIYDSENGKTCHQCRQKTRDFVVSCKHQKNDSSYCTIKFCHKCLLNRYGESAEEMEALEYWACPRCRGICNCSFCMKKRGHNPTGILVHAAKKTGFSSVSEMLHISPNDSCISHQEPLEDLPTQLVSEIDMDGSGISSLEILAMVAGIDGDKKKKHRRKQSKQNISSDHNQTMKKYTLKKYENKSTIDGDKKITKCRLNESKPKSCYHFDNLIHELMLRESETNNSSDGDKVKRRRLNELEEKDSTLIEPKQKDSDEVHNLNDNKITDADVLPPLPEGIAVTNVAGIDVASEDVGPALQVLEFYKAFGKVLDLKEEPPQSILRELTGGGSRQRRHHSPATEFHTILLSLIQKDTKEECDLSAISSTSWLQALGGCISESQCPLKEIPLGCFVKDGIEYETLDPSRKLKILAWLCDEALSTKRLRDWIDEQNSLFKEQAKRGKEQVTAAKDKEKQLRQNLQNEVAKALLKDEAPLSISEHDDLLANIKRQAEEAHIEALEAEIMVPKIKQRSDAVRTEPAFLDGSGNKFWILQSYSDEPNILRQAFEPQDSAAPVEKWFAYTAEQKEEAERFISPMR